MSKVILLKLLRRKVTRSSLVLTNSASKLLDLSGFDQVRNSAAPAREEMMRKREMTNRYMGFVADLGIDIEFDAR